MKISARQFGRIRDLFCRLHNENYRNAQGDNAYDVSRRQKEYQVKLGAMLSRIVKSQRATRKTR